MNIDIVKLQSYRNFRQAIKYRYVSLKINLDSPIARQISERNIQKMLVIYREEEEDFVYRHCLNPSIGNRPPETQ